MMNLPQNNRPLNRRDLSANHRDLAHLQHQANLGRTSRDSLRETLFDEAQLSGDLALFVLFKIGQVASAEVTLAQMFPHAQHRFSSVAEIYAMDSAEAVAEARRRRR